MHTNSKKFIIIFATAAILCGLLNFVTLFTNALSAGEKLTFVFLVATSLGPIFFAIVWITGICVWQKDHMKTVDFIGYSACVLSFLVIGYWCHISGYRLANLIQTFALWNAFALFALTWGLLMVGTLTLKTGILPRMGVCLWITGSLAAISGLGYQWPGRFIMVTIGLIWCGVYCLRNKKNISHEIHGDSHSHDKPSRLESLDLCRGLIIILMAIDHASFMIRKTHPFEYWQYPVPAYYGDIAAFLTRFITHFCAPGFFFLMGIGLVMYGQSRKKRGWSNGRMIKALALRGLLIIFLEKLLWNPLVFGASSITFSGVLFALGAALVVCSLFLQFNTMILLCAGVTGILITQILPQLMMDMGLFGNPLVALFLVPKMTGTWINGYPVFAWMCITLLGMAFGKEVLKDRKKAFSRLLFSGLACLVLFFPIRWASGYGNFQPWAGSGIIEFLNVVKYPPSLVFILLTLGVISIVIYLFEKFNGIPGVFKKPLLVFGQTSLYFYFAHWFFFGGISGMFFLIKANFLWVYAGWGIGLIMLYPVCSRYLKFKQQCNSDSIWRFI